jgi:uncharacterized protein (DUF983 family)
MLSKKKIIHFIVGYFIYGFILGVVMFILDHDNPSPWKFILFWAFLMAIFDVLILDKIRNYTASNIKK